MNKEPYSSLYKILGFYPDNIHLYEQAFHHKSSSIESSDGRWLNNERLEFLGDAILDAVVADIVFNHFQNKREGFLTNTRSKIVQRDTLNRVAVELGLEKMVVYSAKVNSHNNYMYGNALEALIGAIYLDQGYEVCYNFIQNVLIKKYVNLETIARKEVNFKSSLIEWSQKNKLEISFDLIESFTDNDGNPVIPDWRDALRHADRSRHRLFEKRIPAKRSQDGDQKVADRQDIPAIHLRAQKEENRREHSR